MNVMTRHSRRRLLVGITLLTFLTIGLPDGILGVAWPSIRETFILPLDAMGVFLTVFTAGFLISSFNSGRIISGIGVGPLLVISHALAGFGLAGYVVAPSWWAMVACSFLVGLGSGTTDAGINTYVAVNHSSRVMNWSHACFGLGATIGPALMTTIFALGYSWRYGYAVVATLRALLALAFGLTLFHWRGSAAEPSEPVTVHPRTSVSSTLRLPITWLSIAMFLVYTGLELTAGQWAYSLFTEGRGISPEIAGLWISIYWGSLTAGRLLIGFVSDRISGIRLMRLCFLGMLCGGVLLSLRGSSTLSFLGLALVGFACAPIFPSLIGLTPGRVGALHAPNAIGFELSAAAMGGAVLPGLTGVLAQNVGLEVVGPVLVVSAIVIFGLHEAVIHMATSRQPGGTLV